MKLWGWPLLNKFRHPDKTPLFCLVFGDQFLVTFRWLAAQNYYVHKTCFREIANIQRTYVPLCGHTTFVLLTLASSMTIIDKITIFCNDVNKTSTSVELLTINILRYMSQRSDVGLGIKSMARLKTFVEEWNGHNAFVHPLQFDELLQ